MSGNLQKCEAVDRFLVPRGIEEIDPRVARDVFAGLRAANAGIKPAALVMLRRALERACKVAGSTGNTLDARIKQLEQQGIISRVQAASAHAVRAFANAYGAHPDDDLLDDVDDDDIETAVRLTSAVVAGLARTHRKG